MHIHLCTLMYTTGRVTALLPGFFHSVDWSWLGPHLGCRNPRPQEVAGHHRRRSRSKETLDAVSAASLLEEAQVRGVARTHPSPSCWNMPAGSPCGPGAIMVIVAVPGGVPGGLSTPESSSTACAARENENKGHGRVCLSFSRSLPPPRACQCCDACGLTVF